jgi:hypothetical protein
VEVWSDVILIIAILVVIFAGSERGQYEKKYRKLEKKYNELAIRTGNPELATTFISEKDLDLIRQLKAQNKIVQADQSGYSQSASLLAHNLKSTSWPISRSLNSY